jgi:hypothetical protein
MSINHRRTLFFLKNGAPLVERKTAAISLADLQFAISLKEISDDDFLLAWHAAVRVSDESRISVIESAATHRFGLSTWHHRYAERFPDQTRYRLPPKRATATQVSK